MPGEWFVYGMLIVPAAAGGICLLLRSTRAVWLTICAAVGFSAVLAGVVVASVFGAAPLLAAGGWISVDALSAWHLTVLMIVFLLSSVYGVVYFRAETGTAGLNLAQTRRYGALWLGSLAAMTVVLVSNNLGIMWVGIEATTLLTAFLICIHVSPASLEAMWKYLIVCSVGVAFAFIGTLLVAASAAGLNLPPSETLLWTQLRGVATQLDPALMKMAFLFLLVGYGTKAGLAPMHNWLPDAHSQAPAPVSAVFSGFMLNAALYCIIRYVPLVEAATGASGWSLGLLSFFGLLSILISAAFIILQHDAKRLLAYHSVEHIGIIALGVALGGIGVFAALFHTLNHSVCKTLGFFSAGRLGQKYGTHDMTRMAGAFRITPWWGGGFFVSLLALIGVAPFAIFMSEFQILKAAVDRQAMATLILFMVGTGIVFVGALRHGILVAWGEEVEPPRAERTSAVEIALVVAPLAALLFLGLWMPAPLRSAIQAAAAIVEGHP